MSTYQLSEIYIYPIKSLGGIALDQSIVESRGLQYDRRWMIVNDNNQFMTQRRYAEMALLEVTMNNDGLRVTHKVKDVSPLEIPFAYDAAHSAQVNIWNSKCQANEVSKDANRWFSKVLEVSCKLVYMPDSTKRSVDSEKVQNQIVSFADGYPFLIIGQGSLDDLNNRLTNPVPMNRFRPNLVFTGGLPYEEDNWQQFKVGNSFFLGVKKCGRCRIPTINQETGEMGSEPMQILKSYRQSDQVVTFGMNAVNLQAGKIQVGDPIRIGD